MQNEVTSFMLISWILSGWNETNYATISSKSRFFRPGLKLPSLMQNRTARHPPEIFITSSTKFWSIIMTGVFVTFHETEAFKETATKNLLAFFVLVYRLVLLQYKI
jgi:hypothetical protein